MNKSMVFSFDEFDILVAEVTYGTVGFSYDAFDGFHYVETMDDDEWDEFLEIHEKDLEEEMANYVCTEWDEEELVYAMIGKKFDMVVKHIIVDYFEDMVAIIFE